MSILESIRTAENKAEQMKAKAYEESEALIEATKVHVKTKIEKLNQEAEAQMVRTIQETEDRILVLEKQIDEQTHNQDLLLKEIAHKRLKTTVSQMMKKVLDL